MSNKQSTQRWLSVVSSLILTCSAHATSSSQTFHYPDQVNQLMSQINPQNILDNLTMLTSYYNRDSYTKNGVEAADWIKQQLDNMVLASGRDDVTVTTLDVYHAKTPCIIMKIGKSNAPAIVLGGHMDTPHNPFPEPHPYANPSADNNGSGTAVLMETARDLLSSHLSFQKPIYLIWYSADSLSNDGSKAVINQFQTTQTPVDSVLSIEQIGYASYRTPEMVWLTLEDTDYALTQYVRKLAHTYVKYPVNYTTSTGSVSKNYEAWHNAGYPIAKLEEAEYNDINPYAFSASDDTMDHLSITHMTNYAKLIMAFVVEKAELVSPK